MGNGEGPDKYIEEINSSKTGSPKGGGSYNVFEEAEIEKYEKEQEKELDDLPDEL